MDVTVKLIQVKRGNAVSWTSQNPTLKDGEPGYERDTNKLKIGNGTQAWNDLPYISSEALSTNMVKGKMTVKYIGTIPFSVIMGGSDSVNWQIGDIYMGEVENGKIQVGKITSLPINNITDLDPAMEGEIL